MDIMEFENLQELLSGSIYCEKTHFFVILMVFCFEGFFRSLLWIANDIEVLCCSEFVFFFSYFLLNPYFDEFLSHQKLILEITSTCRLIGRVATIRVSTLIGGLMFLCFSYNIVNVHK